MWDFWRRHKRKVYITVGVLSTGYVLHKLYDIRRHSLIDLEKQHAEERKTEELIKSQLQSHFESVQRIADTTTVPHVMDLLHSRLAENLDLNPLMQRLIQGKGQPSTLTSVEKLELWNRLKVLSFTKMISSLWAVTLLSLFIKVQVNILGRHLYIDTARELQSRLQLDDAELIDKNDEQQFLGCADYLSNYALPALISDTETATSKILKGKELKDFFNVKLLHDTIIDILDTLMIMGSPHHWIGYLIPEDADNCKPLAPLSSSSSISDLLNAGKFELLMVETRSVLSRYIYSLSAAASAIAHLTETSTEFANLVDVSLRTLVNGILEDLSIRCGDNNLISGMPLARLVPRVAHMGQLLLSEPFQNRHIQILQSMPEVEQFFTLLYSSAPSS